MSGSTGLRGIPPTSVRHDARQVRRWRRQRLVAAGYDELAAHRLARRADTDVHALLVRRDASALRVVVCDEQRKGRRG